MKKTTLLFLAIASVFSGCTTEDLTEDAMYSDALGHWKLVKRKKFVMFTQTSSNVEIENTTILKIQDDGQVKLTNTQTNFSTEGIIATYQDAWGITKLEVDFYPDLDPTTISSTDTFLNYRLSSDSTDVVLQNDTLVSFHFISGALVCDHIYYTDKFVRIPN